MGRCATPLTGASAVIGALESQPAVSMLVAKSENKLSEPKVKDWDDNYKA